MYRFLGFNPTGYQPNCAPAFVKVFGHSFLITSYVIGFDLMIRIKHICFWRGPFSQWTIPLSKEVTVSYAQFVRFAMQNIIAPPSAGPSVKSRKNLVQRVLKWKASRIDDSWIANPKMRFKPEEIQLVEEVSGLGYKDFLKQEHQALSKADNVLYPSDPIIQRAIFIGVGAFLSALGNKEHLDKFNQLPNLGDR